MADAAVMPSRSSATSQMALPRLASHQRRRRPPADPGLEIPSGSVLSPVDSSSPTPPPSLSWSTSELGLDMELRPSLTTAETQQPLSSSRLTTIRRLVPANCSMMAANPSHLYPTLPSFKCTQSELNSCLSRTLQRLMWVAAAKSLASRWDLLASTEPSRATLQVTISFDCHLL